MPRRCFISHAYKDEQALDEMLSCLPDYVEPVLFPPINVSPHQRVSDDLVGSILSCQGLIYLDSRHSSGSFWVEFEKDYALRAKKPVYRYSQGQRKFVKIYGRPLDIAVFHNYSRADFDVVRAITDFMKKRYFSVWLDVEELQFGDDFRAAVERGLLGTLKKGGYVVSFVSSSLLNSEFARQEIGYAMRHHQTQIILALLEPVDRPVMPYFKPQFSLELYGETNISSNAKKRIY